MKRKAVSVLFLSAILATSLVVSSCGGSGGNGGGGKSGNVNITTDADWVAYQDSNGTWHTLSTVSKTGNEDSVKTYSFHVNNKYGVAVYCADDDEGNIYHLTKNELSNLTYYCNPPYNKYSVSGSFDNLVSDGYGIVAIDGRIGSSTNSSFLVNNVPEGKWDIVAVEMNSDGDPTRRIAIKRDVEVNSNLTGQTISFVDNSVVPYAFSVKDNGNEGFGFVQFLTKNNTIIQNGKKDETETSGEWYRIQNIPLDNQDSYLFTGFSADGTKTRIEAIPAKDMDRTSKNIDLTNISPLTSGSFDPATKTVSGLNYTPTGNIKNLNAYIIYISNDTNSWEITVSKSWLGERDSYTLPDFSELDGFNNTWWFNNFSIITVKLMAIMTDVSPDELINIDPRLKKKGLIFRSGTFEQAKQTLQGD